MKRSPGGLDRARRVIEASRHNTFFTLDVSDILDYGAMQIGSESEARALLDASLRDPALVKDIVSYHGRPRTAGGRSFSFTEATIGRLVGKYWNALPTVEVLRSHVQALKGDVPFGRELSIDENPPDLATSECITSVEEIVFLAVELERRHLPVTYITPNFGVEKGTDYRCSDGLEARVRAIARLAAERNLMLDCHSGDDLHWKTRWTFGRVTGGRIHFKLSPQLQILFAETLFDVQRELFQRWWADVHALVSDEAAKGSAFAVRCLKELEADPSPHPSRSLFHHYCFVSVGRRDERGRFVNRESLYDIYSQFLAEYGDRLEEYLIQIAADLYDWR